MTHLTYLKMYASAADLGAQLYYAAQAGGAEECRKLIAEGADPSWRQSDGTTPLSVSCYGGFVDIAAMLLDSGAEVETTNPYGITPLWVACSRGELEVASLLLSRGAQINRADSDKVQPLHIASQKGHVDVVRHLLDRGAYVDSVTSSRATALCLASQWNHEPVARLLLSRGAAVDALSDEGTPLWIASHNSHGDVVRLLLSHRADVRVVHAGESAVETVDESLVPLFWMPCVQLIAARLPAADLPPMDPPSELSPHALRGAIALLADRPASSFNYWTKLRNAGMHDADAVLLACCLRLNTSCTRMRWVGGGGGGGCTPVAHIARARSLSSVFFSTGCVRGVRG